MTFVQVYDKMVKFLASHEQQINVLCADMNRERNRVDRILGYSYTGYCPGMRNISHPKLSGKYFTPREVAVALDQLAEDDAGILAAAEACVAAAQAD